VPGAADSHRVALGGVVIPWVEGDVGLRHLGYWIDMHADGGNQVHRVEKTITEFTKHVRYARVSKPMLLYLVETVLVPRVIYPLTVVGVSASGNRGLEGMVLKWVLSKLGLTTTYSRQLIAMSTDMGGWAGSRGWPGWREREASWPWT
jgi:hypothetical protein